MVMMGGEWQRERREGLIAYYLKQCAEFWDSKFLAPFFFTSSERRLVLHTHD